MQEQRRLAFGHRFHRRLLEVGGQLWEVVGELQQQLELVLALHVGEVGHDLGERTGHAHAHADSGTDPGLSPATIGTRTVLPPHSVHDPS